jgi:signal transduction histidine kinase
MKNTTECAKAEVVATARQAQLIRRLAHDLRQPLSSIECIAYYMDMVLGDHEPELQMQCEALRRMVQQAHWLLEDATLVVTVRGAACGPVSLSTVLTKLGAEMALHEERSLELRMEPGVTVLAPVAAAADFCNHVLSFFRNVARAEDPIQVTVAGGDSVSLEISAEVLGEPRELLPMVEPEEGSGLHAFVKAAGGRMAASASGQRLTLAFRLPAAEQTTELFVVGVGGIHDEQREIVSERGDGSGGFDNPVVGVGEERVELGQGSAEVAAEPEGTGGAGLKKAASVASGSGH